MEPTTRLVGGDVVLPDSTRTCDVVIEAGRIVAVGDQGPSAAEIVIDVAGLRIAPGFVDLQINGGLGHDFTTDPRSMWALGAALPATGVTSFLPTIITSPPAAADAALAAIASRPDFHQGAVPLGLHLEGPMLNPSRVGAHPVTRLREPSPALVAGWSRRAGVLMVTLAPELPGALAVVGALTGRGVTVAIGHSEAGPDEIEAAARAGATHVTHLYNAMSPLHHREIGVVGAALTRDDLTVGIIVDGVHVHPSAIGLAWKAKGPGRVALVSDAVAPRGLPAGPYRVGDDQLLHDATGIRTTDGTLAGSSLTLDEAVRNLVAATGCRWDEAARAASSTPARIIDAAAKGEIAPGRDADLVVLDDHLGVVATIVGGRAVHDPTGLVSSGGALGSS